MGKMVRLLVTTGLAGASLMAMAPPAAAGPVAPCIIYVIVYGRNITIPFVGEVTTYTHSVCVT